MVGTPQTSMLGVKGAIILPGLWESFNYALFDFLCGMYVLNNLFMDIFSSTTGTIHLQIYLTIFFFLSDFLFRIFRIYIRYFVSPVCHF